MSAADLAAARTQAYAAQRQVITTSPPFSTFACPGAGKTRVIIDRHLSRAVPVRQGRAITSYTRMAAAELHRRCMEAGRPDLTGHPHFIGTVDTFLWLHLVRPFLPPGRIWQRLESWRDAPAKSTEFTCGQAYNLADADFGYDPYTDNWSARPAGVARRGQLPIGWARQACRTRADLERAGYLTGAELRARACHNLASHASKLGELLTAKYSELVVDEAQDCSVADLYILGQLYDAGLPLIVVADPDQAIYGFRGAAVDALADLADRLGHHDLTHNWRSTTVICALAATLRGDHARRVPDTAVAAHRDVGHPVVVYAGNDRQAMTADFVGHAAKIGIRPGNCLILAHAHATLPKAYTGVPIPPSSKAAALAWAGGIISEYPATSGRVRSRARDILARTVLRWWYPDADDLTPAQSLAAHDLDPAEFERLLHRIATALPSLDQPMGRWTPAAAAVLSGNPPAAGAVRTRNRLVCAGKASSSARSVTGLPPTAATGVRPRLSTVHQAKGDQAEAVLLFMPGGSVTDDTLTAWLSGTPADSEVEEALRVVYVGVTRARRLLGLAVPSSYQGRLLAHLHRHAIPAELR